MWIGLIEEVTKIGASALLLILEIEEKSTTGWWLGYSLLLLFNMLLRLLGGLVEEVHNVEAKSDCTEVGVVVLACKPLGEDAKENDGMDSDVDKAKDDDVL